MIFYLGGHKVHSMTASHTISPSKTVTYTGGYPSFFEGSVPKLTYAEITIETVRMDAINAIASNQA